MQDIDLNMKNNFRQARHKLVILYLLIIGAIIGIFSLLIVYQVHDSFSDPAVQTNNEIQVTVAEARDIAKRLQPGKEIVETEYEIEQGVLYFTMGYADESEVKVNILSGETFVEENDDSLWVTLFDDFEEKVGWIALVVFALASLLSVFVANRTLRPIAENIRLHKQFISDVAHELRNPLAALHARIESVIRSGASLFKKEIFDDLLQETKRLITMSENILMLEKNEVREKQVAPQSVTTTISRVCGRLEHTRVEKQISIITTLDTELLPIDIHDLEAILYNILHNALKFTPPHGTITILWQKKKLTVQDTGIGIADADKERVFDRFYKADSARTDEGSGLGLSLVREIVDWYGGTIEVTDVLPQGMSITIQFK